MTYKNRKLAVAALALLLVMSFPQQTESKQPLAKINNNPLNIKTLSTKECWVEQTGCDRFGHAVFSNPKYGIRAAAMVLKNYQKRHKIDTVEKIVFRFTKRRCPEYVRFLSKKLKVKPNQKINVMRRLPELLKHMAKYESGMELPDNLIGEGLELCPLGG